MGATNTGGYDQALSQRLLENNTPASVLYERIRQLEKQSEVLSAEIDRQRPVVEAAVAYLKYEGNDRKELITLRARINSAAFQYEVNKPK